MALPSYNESMALQHIPGSFEDDYSNLFQPAASNTSALDSRMATMSLKPNQTAQVSVDAAVAPSSMNTSADDVWLAVMGVTGSGKSKFIQLCTESQQVKVGHGLESCTAEVDEHLFRHRGKTIHLIDTPGFDDTKRNDRAVLEDIATWLGTAYAANIQLVGIIYLHRIIDPRVGGIAYNNLKMFRKLCGENYYPRIYLVTSMWDIVSPEDGNRRETQLTQTDDFWAKMIQGGSQVGRHRGTRESAVAVLDSVLANRSSCPAPTFTQVQQELASGKGLDETAAGQELSAKILAERRRYEGKLQEMRDEMAEAIREQDHRAQQEIKRERQRLESKIRQGREDQQNLHVKLEDMQQQYTEQLQKMEAALERLQEERDALETDLENKKTQLAHENPNSRNAMILSQKIANGEKELNQRDQILAEQEAKVMKRKRNFVSRGINWVKKNPNQAMRIGMVGFKFLNTAVQSHKRSLLARAPQQVDARRQMNPRQGSQWTKLGAAALGGAALGCIEGEISDAGEDGPITDSFYGSPDAQIPEPEPEPIASFAAPATPPAPPTDDTISQYTQLMNAQASWGPLQTCASMPIG